MKKKLIYGLLGACFLILAGCADNRLPVQDTPTEGTEIQEESSSIMGEETSTESEEAISSDVLEESTQEKTNRKDLTSINPYNYMVYNSIVSNGNNHRLKTVLEKLKNGETIKLATLGGSITEGAGPKSNDDGYAYQFAKRLADEFGNGSNVEFVNAGLSGTPSALGVMRYQKDVLEPLGGAPDLLIIEFAVNDYMEVTGGRALESLIYQAYTDNEDCAVILIFSVSRPGYSEQNNMIPTGMYYGVPMVSMKNALDSGKMTKEEYFSDDYHPTKEGHTLMCDCLIRLLMVIEEEKTEEVFEIPSEAKKSRDFAYMTLVTGSDEVPENNSVLSFGSFTEQDNAVQSCYFTKKSSFPENFMKTSADNQPLVMEMNCKKILLNYKSANDSSFGEAQIYVDGQLMTTVNGYSASGWNNCTVALVLDEEEEANHQLEIKMAPGSEEKKFTVLAVAYR